MIHDATGKFSSRWVFPDRSSLALVIKRTGYIGPKWLKAPMLCAHATGSRPHIGEYAAKTNALWAIEPCRRAGDWAGKQPLRDGSGTRMRAYWPWFFRTW